MIKGFYAAASAMAAGINQQSILAHNVSNMNTPGFKQVLTALNDFYESPVVQPHNGLSTFSALGADVRRSYVGQLGLGVETDPEETDYTDGALLFTGQQLDLAIHGSGFFRVLTPDGERFTRDGRFSRDAEGQLTSIDGYKVLDDGGQPIAITEEGDISVSLDGVITVNGNVQATVGLAAFEDPETELVRDASNLFSAAGGPTSENRGMIEQGFVEGANTNPAELMTRMVQIARAYEAAQKMVITQDEMLGKAISQLGRL